MGKPREAQSGDVEIGAQRLPGFLNLPPDPIGLVVFAHGSGSSRLSPRNRTVARGMVGCRLATLLFDLLTEREAFDRRNIFDIGLLASRVVEVVRWVARQPASAGLPVGLFGASTGAAAALVAAARKPERIAAVVSRGGRPDMANGSLAAVRAPTLLLVGSRDRQVVELNRYALDRLRCTKCLELVEGATHLFEEPGTMEAVIARASEWFERHLGAAYPRLPGTPNDV